MNFIFLNGQIFAYFCFLCYFESKVIYILTLTCMGNFECGKPINDSSNENPNKKWVLDLDQWMLKLREQRPSDKELFISETWLCYTKTLENGVSWGIKDGFSINWELWRILTSLKKHWDNRISEKSKVFGPLMRIWRLELELKTKKDFLKKEEQEDEK